MMNKQTSSQIFRDIPIPGEHLVDALVFKTSSQKNVQTYSCHGHSTGYRGAKVCCIGFLWLNIGNDFVESRC